MKTTLQITGKEDKTSKAGKSYTTFTDSNGQKYSCFEADVIQQVAQNLNNTIDVEVAEANGYKNIRQFYGVVTGNITPPAERVEPALTAPINAPIAKSGNEKLASMLTSYAKDLMIAEVENKTEKSYIELARESQAIIKKIFIQFQTDL